MTDGPSGNLLWRCRRGTRELDVLLERYVSRDYPGASAAERRAFLQILEWPDPVLIDCFLGHVQPAEPDLAALIDRIRTPTR